LILGKVPNIKSLLIILITEFIPFVFLFRKLFSHTQLRFFTLENVLFFVCSQLFPQDKEESLKGINAEKNKVFLSSRWRSHSRYIHSKRQSKWSEGDVHVYVRLCCSCGWGWLQLLFP